MFERKPGAAKSQLTNNKKPDEKYISTLRAFTFFLKKGLNYGKLEFVIYCHGFNDRMTMNDIVTGTTAQA